ncbi:MAG: FliI/YscN family ATPase [Candidatus Eisenbacteria bacterium]|uniref:FliI/YscN family ATPase n=1 Tax=Eiseniibacteriota bacterium TaxID=2212470 RepID=A0A849T2U1_UNCEI|nr:FliI/YscN family ATPase [Candidatus Eisenbacteria bacterium]
MRETEMNWLSHALEVVDTSPRFEIRARVTRVIGQVIETSSLPSAVGELCRIAHDDRHGMLAQVVGFHERGVLLMPLGDTEGVRPGAWVVPLGRGFYANVGEGLVGRVLDGLGRPIEGRPIQGPRIERSLHCAPPPPLERPRVTRALGTGVRAIDGLLTLGHGQRIGIMAGSGVGKSVLLGMIARRTTADVNVIALLGERGREVREFLERDLGPEGLARSVVIVATSDQPAVVRATGALVATAIAEHFRDQGRDVLLMMDSVTRVAMAWREIGLAVGEPPTTKGYPPSTFAALPRLLERAGTSERGSITGLYTVLVEGDDFNEPIADAARSILDGHIVLTRRLANSKHYPAIDVLESVSRVRDQVLDPATLNATNTVLKLEAAYRAHEDLIAVGAYKAGVDPTVDAAIALRGEWLDFLQQAPEEGTGLEEISSRVRALALAAGKAVGPRDGGAA